MSNNNNDDDNNIVWAEEPNKKKKDIDIYDEEMEGILYGPNNEPYYG